MSAPEPGSIIHVVIGQEGSHSDASEWWVAAYLDREKALEHVKKVQEWYDKNRADYVEADYDYDVLRKQNPYDTCDSFGREREYSVWPLFVHFNVENYRAEAATLADKARELGYLPS